MPRRPRLKTVTEKLALAFLPKPEEVKKKRLEELIEDMSFRVAAAAEDAWSKGKAAGRVGNIPLPSDPIAREWARRWFLSGYGLALLDYTVEATKRMKAAADLDQQESAKGLVV